MTEQEWLACTDPQPMLQFLGDRASDRKLRLFACACCRRMWNMFEDERSRKAVEAAEQYADGLATEQEREEVAEGAGAANRLTYFAAPAASAIGHDAVRAASGASQLSAAYAVDADSTDEAELVAQATLLRDIIGNTILRATVDASWLAWNDGTVVKLAQAIYDERAFDRLPVLADALEEAGCHDPDILAHCREPGEHVRGCWVVDLLSGKE